MIQKDASLDIFWFEVISCMNMPIADLSLPLAPSGFYLKTVTPPPITFEQIYISSMPYLAITVLALIWMLIFFQLDLWFPSADDAKIIMLSGM
jgi:TRAP-type mannitol/chloroaromatic compound transport system permease large subunit